MGCYSSKPTAVSNGGDFTTYNLPPGNQPPPQPGASVSSTPRQGRPPMASIDDIDRISRQGEHHEALVAHSMNARNGYDVREVYDLGHFLGRGAFGEIYKVKHRMGGPDLALKILRPIEIIQRIPLNNYDDITYRVGEIKSLLLLRNVEHILQIKEFYFNFNHQPQAAPLSLITELMQGEDLDRWIRQRASMAEGVTEVTASDIAQSLLRAVEHMHRRNIVHRDLKVSNIRITNPLDPSSIKVYDFGLAKVLDQQQPFAQEDCGSLGYTAPELLRKEPYGVEVDMFSAGVILFVVLSGYRPFNLPGADKNVIRQRIINCEYNMDQVRWSRVSPEAQQLVRSLMVEREYRLKASEAVQHKWFREDEATLANHNLRENVTYMETGAELEPRWQTDHTGESTIPPVKVDPAVKSILSKIHSDHIGSGQFSFFTSETSVTATTLYDFVVNSKEDYTEDFCRMLFFKIFQAFETLHRRNIIHRSIRREHIYVKTDSKGGFKVIIGGMNLARVAENGNPVTGNCGTSLVATAPEVYRAISYNESVDSWALGVLLYEFLTGTFPFEGAGRQLRENIGRAAIRFVGFYPATDESRDLIRGLIAADPSDRLSVKEALQHNWFRLPSASNDLSLAKEILADDSTSWQ